MHLLKFLYAKYICRIKAWDVIIFVPNLLFLLILIARFNRARLKLRATSSPIFITFYGLVSILSIMLYYALYYNFIHSKKNL